ncbi:MAG: CopG family transcriptional regulator [Caproiciproducens sp.]|jgi:Leu/Phe-tRNA-protein transferase|nr:CopG family transcriptional regulator [Caproiciproducens sp.]
MKPKKLGRPVSENPKDKIVKIRMDSREVKVLDECCKKRKISRSDVIRQGISKIYADLK